MKTIPYVHGEYQTKDSWEGEERDIAAELPPIKPNRKKGGRDIEMAGVGSLTETNLSVHNLISSNVNPIISNFTSPIGEFRCYFDFFSLTTLLIDLVYTAPENGNTSRLTFNRR